MVELFILIIIIGIYYSIVSDGHNHMWGDWQPHGDGIFQSRTCRTCGLTKTKTVF